MIFIQQHYGGDNQGGRRINVDEDRAVEVFDNAGGIWIVIRGGPGKRHDVVVQQDVALALALLLCEKAGIEVLIDA